MNTKAQNRKEIDHIRRGVGVVILGMLLAFSGCSRQADLLPPTIPYGQAECSSCKMIISDEAFAAAAVVITADGVSKPIFDDIGCLIEYLRFAPPATRTLAFVHDHESRQWIDAEQALLLRSDSLETPMASHLLACRSRSDLEALAARYPGQTTDFAAMRRALAVDSIGGNEKKGDFP